VDPAVAQVLNRVAGGFQRVGAGVELDLALAGEGYQAGQIGAGADEIRHDADFAQDQRHGRESYRAAIANHVVRAPRAQHRHGVTDRGVFADEVEDRVGTGAGEVTDLLHLLRAGDDQVVRAAVHGQCQRLLTEVHRDDLRHGHGLEALDADVTEPSDAYYYGR